MQIWRLGGWENFVGKWEELVFNALDSRRFWPTPTCIWQLTPDWCCRIIITTDCVFSALFTVAKITVVWKVCLTNWCYVLVLLCAELLVSFESAMFLGSITKALLVVSASVHSFFLYLQSCCSITLTALLVLWNLLCIFAHMSKNECFHNDTVCILSLVSAVVLCLCGIVSVVLVV